MPRMNIGYKSDDTEFKRAKYLSSDHVKAKIFDSFMAQLEVYDQCVFGPIKENGKGTKIVDIVKLDNGQAKSVADDIKENIEYLAEEMWKRHAETVRKGRQTRQRNKQKKLALQSNGKGNSNTKHKGNNGGNSKGNNNAHNEHRQERTSH